jgi:beta-glucanase (GH16 family)
MTTTKTNSLMRYCNIPHLPWLVVAIGFFVWFLITGVWSSSSSSGCCTEVAATTTNSFATTTTTTTTSTTLPIWSEEFNYDGPPDPTIWSYDLGSNRSNQELETYTSHPDNVIVENGTLRIMARRHPTTVSQTNNNTNTNNSNKTSFTSARIHTRNKVTLKYGRIEASIQIPTTLANGLWPAFWMEGNTKNHPMVKKWPQCGEIDIMEMGSRAGIARGTVNRRVTSTAHWYDTTTQSHAQNGHFLETPTDLNKNTTTTTTTTTTTAAFHNFTLDWTPYALTTYVDGARIWTMDISTTDNNNGSTTAMMVFHQPYFILLNLAIGGDYPAIYNPTHITAPFPAEYRIDYIRMYANEFTVLGGTYSEYFATTTTTTNVA